MPKTPKGHKRPADVVSHAVHVMKIATGEIEEVGQTDDGRSKAAVERGRKGGLARAKSLSSKRRIETPTPANATGFARSSRCEDRPPRRRRSTKLDVEGILAFAERILPRASDMWVQASLDYKQRLQQLFFP